jgi:hypothetical protein
MVLAWGSPCRGHQLLCPAPQQHHHQCHWSTFRVVFWAFVRTTAVRLQFGSIPLPLLSSSAYIRSHCCHHIKGTVAVGHLCCSSIWPAEGGLTFQVCYLLVACSRPAMCGCTLWLNAARAIAQQLACLLHSHVLPDTRTSAWPQTHTCIH